MTNLGESDMGDGATAEEHAHRRRSQALQQEVIDEVHRSHGGGEYGDARSALQAAFAHHGLDVPTPEWLSAVASEIANGHAYIVGTESWSDTHPDEHSAH